MDDKRLDLEWSRVAYTGHLSAGANDYSVFASPGGWTAMAVWRRRVPHMGVWPTEDDAKHTCAIDWYMEQFTAPESVRARLRLVWVPYSAEEKARFDAAQKAIYADLVKSDGLVIERTGPTSFRVGLPTSTPT